MKVGVIGAGNWGKNLIRTLNGLEVLGGIAEKDEALRASVRDVYPEVPVFEHHSELLSSPVSAISIATPAETHFELAKTALESGKDVFVEKPMVLSSEHAETLCELAEAQSRVLMVGHLLLYQPAIQWIKAALDRDLIGTVYSFHQERLNLGRARAVENVLWSFGVHDIAVLLYLAGSSLGRVLFSGKAGLQRGIEDDTYLHLEFSSGSVGNIHSSWLWPELRRTLTVVGSKGMLVYDELKQEVRLVRKSIDGQLKNIDEGSELVFQGAGEPLRLEMEHFVACCRDRSTPHSDGRSSIDVIKAMEEADRQRGAMMSALVTG